MNFLLCALVLLIGMAIIISLILLVARLKRNITNASNENAYKEGIDQILSSIHSKSKNEELFLVFSLYITTLLTNVGETNYIKNVQIVLQQLMLT